ncbi:MAG TPA: hypothetical protein VHS31_16595 [Tepidisphaeraceae bacterium]|jgi:hypothetical protein|nr:hypothetical protein [Tepidisphaeraceae bacterium]
MSDSVSHEAVVMGRRPRDHWSRLYIISTIAFISSCAFSAASFALCGPSLALFLSGFFFITPLLPPLMLTQSTWKRRLLVAGCALDGVAFIWLLSAFAPDITLLQWLRCYLILIGYSTMLAGVATALLRLKLAEYFASAITIICSLAWLTWPVWLSPYLTGPHADSIVAWLVWVHPLFAINGVLAHLGAWSHLPIAYQQLTTLGQDIPYTFPASIWPTVVSHIVLGIVLMFIASKTSKSQHRISDVDI